MRAETRSEARPQWRRVQASPHPSLGSRPGSRPRRCYRTRGGGRNTKANMRIAVAGRPRLGDTTSGTAGPGTQRRQRCGEGDGVHRDGRESCRLAGRSRAALVAESGADEERRGSRGLLMQRCRRSPAHAGPVRRSDLGERDRPPRRRSGAAGAIERSPTRSRGLLLRDSESDRRTRGRRRSGYPRKSGSCPKQWQDEGRCEYLTGPGCPPNGEHPGSWT